MSLGVKLTLVSWSIFLFVIILFLLSGSDWPEQMTGVTLDLPRWIYRGLGLVGILFALMAALTLAKEKGLHSLKWKLLIGFLTLFCCFYFVPLGLIWMPPRR